MNDFNLNVEQYNVNDLLDIFELKQPYTMKQLNTNYETILDVLNKEQDPEDKLQHEKIKQFYKDAKNKLVKNLDKNETFELSENKIIVNRVDEPIQTEFGLRNIKNKIDFKHLINKIDQKKISYAVHFDSKFRKDYYSTPASKFMVHLAHPMKNVLSVLLKSIQLPNTWYSFSEEKGNNYFYMTDFSGNDPQEFKVVLQEGNHDTVSFRNNLTYYVKNTSGEWIPYTQTPPLTITISEITGKTTLLHSSSKKFILDFSVNNRPPIYNIGWYMGFRQGRYINDFTYTSEGLFNVARHTYVFFVLHDYKNNTTNKNIAMYENSFLVDDILAKIPIMNSSFTVNFDESNAQAYKRVYTSPVNISHFEIELIDEYGQLINMNNMDHSFTLEFECLYENEYL